MQPISHVNTGAAQQALAGAEREAKAPKAGALGEEALGRPMQGRQDRYAPQEKPFALGLYRPGRDGDGQLKMDFDSPARAEDAPKKPEGPPGGQEAGGSASAPEEAGQGREAEGLEKGGKKDAPCVCDTGRVDREIERLKKEKEELERQLDSETDETQAKALQSRLEQVKRELVEKDNDAYRRQHSTFTQLG